MKGGNCTSCSDFDNSIVWVLQLRHVYLFDRDFVGPIIMEGFHFVVTHGCGLILE